MAKGLAVPFSLILLGLRKVREKKILMVGHNFHSATWCSRIKLTRKKHALHYKLSVVIIGPLKERRNASSCLNSSSLNAV